MLLKRHNVMVKKKPLRLMQKANIYPACAIEVSGGGRRECKLSLLAVNLWCGLVIDSFMTSVGNTLAAILSTWKYRIIVAAINSLLIDWKILVYSIIFK